ncbi:SnoaL-like polyketide cyclase [Mycolicibacterium neoaurum]|uniref:SnoaL-like polyketide cyclase n=1 Tax=Mycolicibacterium neoaurum TaxID=1795 RepID=A0AAV2WE15_MYCNE|nr:SnoaL-like polyketide cyclase [Mycolicibacterium neoaurum]
MRDIPTSSPSNPQSNRPIAPRLRSARDVVEAYNLIAWNQCDLDLANELLGDRVIRHGVGSVTVLTHDEAVARIKDHHAMFESIRFDVRTIVAGVDGEHAAIMYDATIVLDDGTVSAIGSMEIFRVVDGRITEVWNTGHQEGSWA